MNSSWNKDWLEMQKQYMEALTSLGNTAKQQQTGSAQTTEWQKALEQWWQHKQFEMPGDPQAVFSNLLQYSNSWQSFGEQFSDLLKAVSPGEDNNTDWQSALREQIELMKNRMLNTGGNFDARNWLAGMQAPADNWQNLFGSMFSAADPARANSPFTGMPGDIEKLFTLPGLESNPLLQEQMQEGMKLWQAYQNNYQAYRETLNNIDLGSLDKLQEKILALADQDKSISSLRELYNLWVDSHEEVYSQYALTEEYSKLYGQLVNALLQFKAHGQEFLAAGSESLDLSTNDQREALLQEVHEIKRQQKKDRNRIKALEEQVKKMNKGSSVKVKQSGAKKKKKLRKKSPAKKTAPRAKKNKK